MKSYKTDIPSNSLVQQFLPIDYADAFACEIMESKRLLAEEIIIEFWTIMPGWVNSLFKLRNLLVRPFGLETGERENRSEELKKIIRAGQGTIGIMSVVAKSDNETVILLSDAHLNAYMSIQVDEKEDRQTVIATTLVRYHNKLGKVYFLVISPFHKAIVKSMLKSTLQRIAH